MAVVCAAVVLPGAVVWLVPYSSHCSAGEYCCHAAHCSLPGAVVCWWWVCVCGVRVVGYPLSAPSSPFVFAVTVLLVWGCVFVPGLCLCGVVVMVCVG